MTRISSLKTASFHPIGVVRNGVSSQIESGWGSIKSKIRLERKYVRGLRGIEEFSHLVIVFWMHRVGSDKGTIKMLRHPRGSKNFPVRGIFAQRTKVRVNPIGITVVRLLRKRGSTIWVSGLDAIDGTPVLDIKPYFPIFDRPEGFRSPEWVAQAMQGYF